jgi:hypothetical protein
MSPVQAAKPAVSALPFPRPGWMMRRTSGRKRRATATVSSVEWPSTTITPCSPGGSRAKTWGSFLPSFRAGMTTLTRGTEGIGGHFLPALTKPATRSRRYAANPLRKASAGAAYRKRRVYSGMFPCLRFGVSTRFVCSVSSARISFGRVSCGTTTSSRYPRSAAEYGLANLAL